MQIFIDTNVILDALMMREPWAASAQTLLRDAALGKFNSNILASQTTDIFYIIRRQGVDAGAAKSIIRKLTNTINISEVTLADVNNALSSNMNDYEDALLAYCAYRYKAAYIITRNEKDFLESPVSALPPEIFLKQL
jgi:predicted nucleic acid-binding protein